MYASFRTRTPAAVVNVSIRQRDTPAPARAVAASANGMPSSRPTAAAASAFGHHVLAGDGQRHLGLRPS